eukprot:8515737-Alexandrium_andersonii.AAC.1
MHNTHNAQHRTQSSAHIATLTRTHAHTQHDTSLHHNITRRRTEQCSAAQRSTSQRNTKQHSTAQHSTAKQSMGER